MIDFSRENSRDRCCVREEEALLIGVSSFADDFRRINGGEVLWRF